MVGLNLSDQDAKTTVTIFGLATQARCNNYYEVSLQTGFWQGQVSTLQVCRFIVRGVTHNPLRVVTPVRPCSISATKKKAHGQKC